MIASLMVSSAYRQFLVIPRSVLYLVVTAYTVLNNMLPTKSAKSQAIRTTAGYVVWALLAADIGNILEELVPEPTLEERVSLGLLVAGVSVFGFLEPVLYALVLQVTDIAVGVRGGNLPLAFLSGPSAVIFFASLAWLLWAPPAIAPESVLATLWEYSHIGARLVVVRVAVNAVGFDSLEWPEWLSALLLVMCFILAVAPDNLLLDNILQDVTLLLAQQKLRAETALAFSPVTVVAFAWWVWWQHHGRSMVETRPYLQILGQRLAAVALFLWGSAAVAIIGQAIQDASALSQLITITTLLALFFAGAETLNLLVVPTK